MSDKEIKESYKTKNDERITFKFYKNLSGVQEPWRLDRVEAYVGGELAGYIAISYVPKEDFYKKYPTIFDFGKRKIYVDDKDPIDEKLWRLGTEISGWSADDSYKSLSNSEKEKLLNDLIKKYEKKIKPQYDEFIQFHIDKPLVDYIDVEDKYKRMRIGEALYVIASRWLAKRGMKLYASGLQSDSAKASWAHLKSKYASNIGSDTYGLKNKERTYLSHLKEYIDLFVKEETKAKKPNYSALVLYEQSHNELMVAFSQNPDWEILAHHVTLNLGSYKGDRELLGKDFNIAVEKYGENEYVSAVSVLLPAEILSKPNPHITIGVNRTIGGKPMMSNQLDWQMAEHVHPKIVLKAKLVEVMENDNRFADGYEQ